MTRIQPGISAQAARVAIFDFDGTLSLIRSGWFEVMVNTGAEVLRDVSSEEADDSLRAVVQDFVVRLTGKQTVYQMIELARQVEVRGGQPRDPLEYKQIYLNKLQTMIAQRVIDLKDGRVSPDAFLVPGSQPLLESLRAHGLTLYPASGTDQEFVREVASLLALDPFFQQRI